MFVPQTYQGAPLSIGRCLHIAFFKPGFAKTVIEGDKLKTEIIHENQKDRPLPEFVESVHQKDYYYHDIIDVKHQLRVCSHWIPVASYAMEAFSTYGDDLSQFPELPTELAKWLAEGAPLEEREFGRFSPQHNYTYTKKVCPEYVVDSYSPCVLCEHFEHETSPQGAPIPFRGFCNKVKFLGNSLFRLVEQDRPRTYSFLSCHDHSPARRWTREEPREISPRLYFYVETNPLDLSLQQIAEISRFPLVARMDSLEELGLDRLREVDLVRLLKERHSQVDFNQFYADFSLQPIADYFAKGLRAETRHYKEFWAPFSDYKKAEDTLFSDPDISVVDISKPIITSHAHLTTLLETPEHDISSRDISVVLEQDHLTHGSNDFSDLADLDT